MYENICQASDSDDDDDGNDWQYKSDMVKTHLLTWNDNVAVLHPGTLALDRKLHEVILYSSRPVVGQTAMPSYLE